MNSGGEILKRFISLTALLLSISLFLLHGTSFSNAEIKNDAILTIVPEEDALIAIKYGEENNFSIINNTAKAIEISIVEIVNEFDHASVSVIDKSSPSISPGKSLQFTIPSDTNALPGKAIQLVARWNGGNAKIISIIPERIQQATEEELTEEDLDPEINGEDDIIVSPDIDEEEIVNLEQDKDDNDSELDTETIESDIDDEK